MQAVSDKDKIEKTSLSCETFIGNHCHTCIVNNRVDKRSIESVGKPLKKTNW